MQIVYGGGLRAARPAVRCYVVQVDRKGAFVLQSLLMRGAPAVTALRMERVPAVSFRCRPRRFCYTLAAPSGGGFASVATEATPVETAHRAVSKSRLSNPLHLTLKKNRYSNEYRFFWWKVVDSHHRSHRRQIYSLFPLATRETFHMQFPACWSWWTDLNPRPADYKSAALPTELRQRIYFIIAILSKKRYG